jgi:hypothetical protein
MTQANPTRTLAIHVTKNAPAGGDTSAWKHK